MYLRKITRHKDGKSHAYWALMQSYRTERGPRQRVVAYLGELTPEDKQPATTGSANSHQYQPDLFDNREPQWVEINIQNLRVENIVDFGGPWLGLHLLRELELDRFLKEELVQGREEIPWAIMAQVLILSRLCYPSSELEISEHYFSSSSLADQLGIPPDKVNDDRLYRALDKLLPHKDKLEEHLKKRAGELFQLDYNLFIYDVTSTYFEGEAKGNPLAQRGYSRDHRGDCKQVCIALVVSKDGFPLGYELFAGNRTDVTTMEEIVQSMEKKYGQVNRIWVMDRGMASENNFEFLNQNQRRYIVGANRSELKRHEKELLKKSWEHVYADLEVKKVISPETQEVYILCRSAARNLKEKAMHERFEKRIETALAKMTKTSEKRKYPAGIWERRIGRLLGLNSRAAGLFEVAVEVDKKNHARVKWHKNERWREWADLSEGCYLLRSNITDWTAQELWQAYVQLTEAEDAFRIQKSDLKIRPIWHQKEGRVRAHILVCFLAYVLWKTMEGFCRQAGIGDNPAKIFKELSEIKLVDVVVSTRQGETFKLRCVGTPTAHQAILLQRLKLTLPNRFPMQNALQNVVKTFAAGSL
jgi:transposase